SARSSSTTVTDGAADHADESASQPTKAASAPRKRRSLVFSRIALRMMSARATAQRSGTLTHPHDVGKYPPCAAASPNTEANAAAAGSTRSQRLGRASEATATGTASAFIANPPG